MILQGRALYNLLRTNWLQDPTIQVQPWQVEDYRSLPEQELYQRLKKLGVMLTPESLTVYATDCDTPEDLTDCVWLDEEDIEGYDQTYLNILELWRRSFPDNPSLSIFCDELDRCIDLEGSNLEEMLKVLEDLLDEQVDRGIKPKEAFASFSSYLAHDLEHFLYSYIADQMDAENYSYGSELIDGFGDYVKAKPLFDFLRARLLLETDSDAARSFFFKILEDLKQEDLDLLFEILDFLSEGRLPSVFLTAAIQTLGFIQSEEDFQDLIQLIAQFYANLDEKDSQSTFLSFLKKSFPLSSPDTTKIQTLLKNHLKTAE